MDSRSRGRVGRKRAAQPTVHSGANAANWARAANVAHVVDAPHAPRALHGPAAPHAHVAATAARLRRALPGRWVSMLRQALAASLLAPLALAAHAQGAGQSVELTGSRLAAPVGTEPVDLAPAQVLTRDDIRRSGASTLAELLGRLASVTAQQPDHAGGGSMAPGVSAVAMRHLSSQSTLILLNGRRVSPYPLADFGALVTNLDALPLAAIERIEVLKAGASAVYGSDAIAGVIHLITREPGAGGDLQLGWNRSITRGQLDEVDAAVTLGWGGTTRDGTGDAGSGPRVLASLSLYARRHLFWGDTMAQVNPSVTAYSPTYGTPSTYSWPGNLMGAGPLRPGCADVRDGLCQYDRYSRFEAMPSARRATLFVDARQRLPAGREAFGELLLAHTETHYRGPMPVYQTGANPQWVDPGSGELRNFYYPGLPASHPLNVLGTDGAELRYRFIDGPGETLARTLQYRALLGLKGVDGPSAWEAALGAMGGATRARSRGAFSASGFADAIGGQTDGLADADFFSRGYRLGEANSAAVIDQLFPAYGHAGRVQQVFGDLRWRSIWDSALLGPVQVSLGGDARHESMAITPTDALQRGDIIGAGLARTDAGRWVASADGEAMVALTPDATARLAARVDRYQGVAAQLSPLLGLRWNPSERLTLRSGVEHGFRAPNLVERSSAAIYNVAGNVADPARCLPALSLYRTYAAFAQTLPADDPLAVALLQRAVGVLTAECQSSVSRTTVHNPALKPETSRNVTLGLVARPWPRWQFSADFWDLVQRNQISSLSVSDLLAREPLLAPGRVQRDGLSPDNDRSFSAGEQQQFGVATGPLRALTVQFDNLDRIHVQGLDLALQGRLPVAWGVLTLQADVSHLLRARLWDTGGNAWSSDLTGQGSFRRWRGTLHMGLEQGAFRHTLIAQAVSGERLGDADSAASCAGAGLPEALCREAGWARWDYNLSWQPAGAWALSAHLHNLFNRREPVNVARWLAAGGLTPPTLADAQGRMLQLQASWRF